MTLAMWAWHVPGPYQLALQVPFWHERGARHVSCGLAALLVVDRADRGRAVAHWSRGRFHHCLLVGDLANTAIAAILTFSDRVLYPIYDQVPRLAERLGARRSGHGRRRDVGTGFAGVPRPRDQS